MLFKSLRLTYKAPERLPAPMGPDEHMNQIIGDTTQELDKFEASLFSPEEIVAAHEAQRQLSEDLGYPVQVSPDVLPFLHLLEFKANTVRLPNSLEWEIDGDETKIVFAVDNNELQIHAYYGGDAPDQRVSMPINKSITGEVTLGGAKVESVPKGEENEGSSLARLRQGLDSYEDKDRPRFDLKSVNSLSIQFGSYMHEIKLNKGDKFTSFAWEDAKLMDIVDDKAQAELTKEYYGLDKDRTCLRWRSEQASGTLIYSDVPAAPGIVDIRGDSITFKPAYKITKNAIGEKVIETKPEKKVEFTKK